LSHKNVIVIPDYEDEPRNLEAETRDILMQGRWETKKLKTKKGPDMRVPAVLHLNGKPSSQNTMLLKISPHKIYNFLMTDRFLGRRYKLKVNDQIYEVYPTSINLDAINYFPESVAFKEWDGKPKIHFSSLKERFQYRNQDIDYHKEHEFSKRLRDFVKEAKKNSNMYRVVFDEKEKEEFLKAYPKPDKSKPKRFLEEEMIDILKQKKNVLILEKEELKVDEVYGEEEDDDDEEEY